MATPKDSERIIGSLLQEWRDLFLKKNADYEAGGFENHRVLGIKGQFADIWRKIAKLKAALWDGKELTQEPPREVLMDLIGHCFLTIAMIDREEEERAAQQQG